MGEILVLYVAFVYFLVVALDVSFKTILFLSLALFSAIAVLCLASKFLEFLEDYKDQKVEGDIKISFDLLKYYLHMGDAVFVNEHGYSIQISNYYGIGGKLEKFICPVCKKETYANVFQLKKEDDKKIGTCVNCGEEVEVFKINARLSFADFIKYRLYKAYTAYRKRIETKKAQKADKAVQEEKSLQAKNQNDLIAISAMQSHMKKYNKAEQERINSIMEEYKEAASNLKEGLVAMERMETISEKYVQTETVKKPKAINVERELERKTELVLNSMADEGLL